jgi:hypothetical protein
MLPGPGDVDVDVQGQDGDGSGQGVTKTVEVNGQAVALDHLGPVVVARDGTLSRIGNWHEMTDMERQTALRILGKRNQLRLGALRGDKSGSRN